MLFQKYRRAVLPVVAFALCAGTALAGPKPDIAGIEPGPITVTATPIRTFKRFGGADVPLDKLTFRGGLVLTSLSPHFGGWSGLILDADAKSFLAISDSGVWLTGRLTYDGTHPSGIESARLGPLLDRKGMPLRRIRDRDSEWVALASGTLQRGSVLVGFEGRHRIERYDLSANGLSADRGVVQLPAAAKRMRRTQGLEAMTVMQGGPYKGSLIAFSERLYDASRNHTGWLWTGKTPGKASTTRSFTTSTPSAREQVGLPVRLADGEATVCPDDAPPTAGHPRTPPGTHPPAGCPSATGSSSHLSVRRRHLARRQVGDHRSDVLLQFGHGCGVFAAGEVTTWCSAAIDQEGQHHSADDPLHSGNPQ